jgi:hypothetical protein
LGQWFAAATIRTNASNGCDLRQEAFSKIRLGLDARDV